MGQFDPTTWRARAWTRYARARDEGEDRDLCELKQTIDTLAIQDIEKLVAWCADRSIKVSFGKKENGVYETETKEMIISCRAHPAKQVIYLLHECGHHLIGMKEHHDRFGMGYPKVNDPNAVKTNAHRISCLEEEIEAWHRGWRLATRLSLNATREDYDVVRLVCLKSYIRWAARIAT